MRLLHTGDLHIGKTVHEFSMLKDQIHILNQIADIAREEQVDALLLAGDIYDRSVPPAEAVRVFDAFVEQIRELGITMYVISGNHDSAERLSFANGLLKEQGLIIEGSCDDRPEPYCLSEGTDEKAKVNLYLVPYQKSALLQETIAAIEPEPEAVNLLMTHAFVINGGQMPVLSDSEIMPQVGTVEAVDVSLFDAFDYTALGHLHGPQQIGEKPVYYAGSPLKYSFSECNQEKSVWIVEVAEEKESDKKISVRKRELQPLHDMRQIEGKLEILTQEEVDSLADREDYLSVVLTNTEDLLDAMASLRAVYPNVMKLTLKKNLPQQDMSWESVKQVQEKSLTELFREFYVSVRSEEPDEERMEVIQETIAQIEEKQ